MATPDPNMPNPGPSGVVTGAVSYPLGTALSCLLHALVVIAVTLFGSLHGEAGAPEGVSIEIIPLELPPPPKPEEQPQPPAPKPDPKPIKETPTPPPAKQPPTKVRPQPSPRQLPQAQAQTPTQPADDTSSSATSSKPAADAPVMTQTAPSEPALDAGNAVNVGPQRARPGDMQDYALIAWQRIMRYKPTRVPYPGEAKVTFSLSPDGQLLSVVLTGSSGSAFLDQAALDAVRRAAPFPPPPAGSDVDQRTFVIPFHFR